MEIQKSEKMENKLTKWILADIIDLGWGNPIFKWKYLFIKALAKARNNAKLLNTIEYNPEVIKYRP